MRIGVLSDTHRDKFAVKRVVEFAGNVDAWFHCGDNIEDVNILNEGSDKKVPIYFVKGNCDFSTDVPAELIVELEGKKFYIVHGNNYGIINIAQDVMYAAMEKGCDMAVFGHTHISEIQYGEVLVMNPGSPSRPRDVQNIKTFGIITISDSKIIPEIISI